MLTITRLNPMGKTASGGRAAVIEYMMATEYYMGPGGPKSTARWVGDGAQSLGLLGKQVAREDMEKLARGFAPDGRALCQNAGEEPVWVTKFDKDGAPLLDDNGEEQGYWKGGHRIGFDCTLSPPKGVSVLYADSSEEERERILGAHQKASDVAVGVIQEYLETRRGHAGAQVIGVQGLVASVHTHFGAREVPGHPPEMQIHNHVLLYNVACGADGEWSTIDPDAMYKAQRMIGAVYRAEVARNIQDLGYGIEKAPDIDADGRETGEVYFRVAGISEATEKRFSSRHQQIVDYQEEHGGNRRDASLATRAKKDEPPYSELVQQWGEALAAARAEDPAMFRSAQELRGRRSITQPLDDSQILSKLHGREAVWTREDLVAQLARENMGVMRGREAMHEADAFIARNDLVEINPLKPDGASGSRRETQPRYAVRWWIDGLEADMQGHALARRDDESVRIAPEMVDAAAKAFEKERGFALSDDQRKAVDLLASQSGGIALLSGHAGAGKTTSTKVLVDAARLNGQEVLGCSTSWDAAKKLEADTGMESYSTARLLSLLDRGEITLDAKSMVILDEAGMAQTTDVARLSNYVNKAGGKLILEGDAEQLQAVGAGGPFRLLQSAVGDQGHATLSEIIRQDTDEDRQIVHGFYAGVESRTREAQAHQGHALFDAMEKRGQIDHCDTRKHAMDALVRDWMASDTKIEEKIILAGTRQDVRDLNERIHSARREAGVIGEEHSFEVIDAGRRQTIGVSPGDRLRLGARDETLGVVNGTFLNVDAIENGKIQGRISSDIKSEAGRKVTIDPAKYDHFALGYASTVHRAQGQTRDEAYHLATAGMTDRHLSLVAASRHRKSYRMYGSEGDLEVVRERLGQDRLRVNATEEGRMSLRPSAEQQLRATHEARAHLAAQAEEQRRHYREHHL